MRTHCKNGHEWNDDSIRDNGLGYLICRLCKNERERARGTRIRAGKPKVIKTHCNRGHEWTKQNTYLNPNGGARRCRACRAQMYKPPEERDYTPILRSNNGKPIALTPLGEILKCPSCESTKRRARLFKFSCESCGTHYDEYGRKMFKKMKFKPTPKSGYVALPIQRGRGLAGWGIWQ